MKPDTVPLQKTLTWYPRPPKKKHQHVQWYCWWFGNPANQLIWRNLPFIYRGFYTSKRWLALEFHQPINPSTVFETPSPSENNSQALARRFVDLASLELDKHLGRLVGRGSDMDGNWGYFPHLLFEKSQRKWKKSDRKIGKFEVSARNFRIYPRDTYLGTLWTLLKICS